MDVTAYPLAFHKPNPALCQVPKSGWREVLLESGTPSPKVDATKAYDLCFTFLTSAMVTSAGLAAVQVDLHCSNAQEIQQCH